MLRCREVFKCEILLDFLYDFQLVSKFINVVMSDGKKSIVECIFYDVLVFIKECGEEDFFGVFKWVIENVKFVVEVKFCCVGGFIYQVFVEVWFNCKLVLFMCWVIQVVKFCNEKIMKQCFVGEFMDVVENCGNVIKKKEDIYWMVDVNKVFLYYCWQVFWGF